MPNNKKSSKRDFMKYSGWGMQLFISLFIAAFVGKKIDEYFAFEKQWITILLIFVLVFAQFYKLIKELT